MSTLIHKSPPAWLEQVKDLRPGQGRRISDAKRASFNGKSYFLWDFREKEGEVWEPTLSLAEKLAIRKQMQEAVFQATQAPGLPRPRQEVPRDWPAEARVWLHKAHLSNDDIVGMGAYWNAAMHRVVLPLTMLDGSDAWLARSVSREHQPKYIFPKGWHRGGGALVDGAGRTLVITEDYLSAYRIAQATGRPALALMGTTINQDSVSYVVNAYEEVVLWLDGDKAGKDGSINLRRAFGMFDIGIKVITTIKDPKLLSDYEIVEKLL